MPNGDEKTYVPNPSQHSLKMAGDGVDRAITPANVHQTTYVPGATVSGLKKAGS